MGTRRWSVKLPARRWRLSSPHRLQLLWPWPPWRPQPRRPSPVVTAQVDARLFCNRDAFIMVLPSFLPACLPLFSASLPSFSAYTTHSGSKWPKPAKNRFNSVCGFTNFFVATVEISGSGIWLCIRFKICQIFAGISVISQFSHFSFI